MDNAEKAGTKNWQLALYANGLVGKFLNVSNPENPLVIHTVTAHIFQPRVEESVPPVVFTLPELLGEYLVPYLTAIDTTKEIISDIKAAEEEAEIWDTKKIEGHQVVGKWCRFCKAKPICNAYQHSRGVPKAAEVFKRALWAGAVPGPEVAKVTEKEPAKKMWEQGIFSAEEIAFLALNGARIKALIDETQELAVDLIQQGEHLPDCAVEKTEGRRAWIKDSEEVIKVLEGLGVQQPFETIQKIVTISEVEKEIGPGKIGEITEKSEGGLKLVHVSKVKNPAPTGAGAALLFKKHLAES